MKKQFTILAILALAVFITACGSDAQDTAPEVPAAPTVPEPTENTQTGSDSESGSETDSETVNNDPVEGEAQVIDKGSDKLGDGSKEELGSKINSVACNVEESRITFTFENTGEHTWSLDQEVGFAAGGDVKNVKVFMNHRYEMNANKDNFHPVTGELMFGPNELFSENCGGVTELAPGDSVTCTLSPVPLNRGSGSEGLSSVNYILIDSPSIDDLIEFTC